MLVFKQTLSLWRGREVELILYAIRLSKGYNLIPLERFRTLQTAAGVYVNERFGRVIDLPCT